MKLVKIYEDILREGQAEACVAKFGKELFDPQLSVAGGPSKVEPNTDLENYYLFQIDSFTTSRHGKRLKPEFIEAMTNLKKCISSYPEVLHPEGEAFRGESLPLSELLNQFEDITDDLETGGEFGFIYKPKSLIQSWTSHKDTAEGFANISSLLQKFINQYNKVKDDPQQLGEFVKEIYPQLNDARCPITVRLVTSPDDFLFKSKYFTALSQFEDEDELLRINNQPTKVTAEIVDFLLEPVYGILKAVKQYEAKSRK